MSEPALISSRGAVTGPFTRILVGSLPTEAGADAQALGLALARLCGAELLSRTVTDAVQGLHSAAVSEHADLIVVGSSHRGPVGRVLIGSVGERLLDGAPCAVAVASRGYASRERAMERILVAFDGSAEARLALQTAHELAERARGRLTALTVLIPNSPAAAAGAGAREAVAPVSEALGHQESAARATLEAAIADLDGALAEGRIVVGPDAASVVIGVADTRTDLLVVGSRGNGPLRRALLGSVSQQVLRGARCPVIVTPRPASAA